MPRKHHKWHSQHSYWNIGERSMEIRWKEAEFRCVLFHRGNIYPSRVQRWGRGWGRTVPTVLWEWILLLNMGTLALGNNSGSNKGRPSHDMTHKDRTELGAHLQVWTLQYRCMGGHDRQGSQVETSRVGNIIEISKVQLVIAPFLFHSPDYRTLSMTMTWPGHLWLNNKHVHSHWHL